ncbi:MAG: peptidoglycan-associated lipoprotein Pal [Rhodoferax sp.]
MFRLAGLAAACVILVGCGSSVKLDAPVVEDRAGTAVQADQQTAASTGTGAGAQGTGSGVGSTSIKGVDLDNSASAGDVFMKSAARLVYFDYDSYAIRPEFQAVIEAHAKFLKANPARKVALEGHTDERGGREYNLALGQKRAEAVRRAMGLLGVGDAQLEAVSFGKEKPAAQGGSEEAMAKNRRVEIMYR